MRMNFKFLHRVKAQWLLVFGWINRVILGNRKLTISVVPVFIEGKDPLDERIEFFISKESDDLEETYYEDDAHPQERTETTSRDSQAIDTRGIRGVESQPAGI
mgnify:FL=1|jgi:hypothetical protein